MRTKAKAILCTIPILNSAVGSHCFFTYRLHKNKLISGSCRRPANQGRMQISKRTNKNKDSTELLMRANSKALPERCINHTLSCSRVSGNAFP